ncbi:MAG: class I SAM-dependent methyltransferase [Oligoflexia bacterium]|nr:class I SAM-dependent methyltransferase [Oligoflexia bacterium]
MSRLEKLIRRMSAQKQSLDALIERIQKTNLEGFVVEVGLGSGRTYDHLRTYLPNKKIYVFDLEVDCHPTCVPPEGDLFLGYAQETLLPFAAENQGRACLIHCDIGTKDKEHDERIYREITPAILQLSHSGTLIASDRSLISEGLSEISDNQSSADWPYYLYMKN